MKRVLFTFGLLLTLVTYQSNSIATIEVVEFESVKQEIRYKKMIDQLRCLVCQNQNLAGSDAPLAKDLRDITANMIKKGSSDQEIKEFMRARCRQQDELFQPTQAKNSAEQIRVRNLLRDTPSLNSKDGDKS